MRRTSDPASVPLPRGLIPAQPMHVRFDSVGGASGDMILGALVDLGTNKDDLQGPLESLVGRSFTLDAQPYAEHGLGGLRLSVKLDEPEHHHHRSHADIRAMIQASDLPAGVIERSLAIFQRLAVAEAHIHAQSVVDVPFHEVGALDSIIDIVGVCLALDTLEVESISNGPLPLGQGTTQSAHGVIPIPAPATLALLEGTPVITTQEPFELVTPTGAAILTALQGPAPDVAIARGSGTGFGQRSLEGRPNLIRATLLETAATTDPSTDTCLVLECNLDDMVPELLGSLTEKLLGSGALDVYTTPIQMKKQRHGVLLTVLCRPADRDTTLDLIFGESTTFGVREYETTRTTLTRRFATVQTPYGDVRVKVGEWKGRVITSSPEHDDCVRCAEAGNVSVRTVYESTLAARGGDNQPQENG